MITVGIRAMLHGEAKNEWALPSNRLTLVCGLWPMPDGFLKPKPNGEAQAAIRHSRTAFPEGLLSRAKPLSAAALGVGVTCLGIATALRFAGGWSKSDLRYAIFLPAILATGLLAGAPAAISVMIASLVTVAWAFMPPYFAFKSLSSPELATVFWIFFSGLCVILFAQGCRTVLKRLRAHQLTNDILVRELAHRGRNIFAVIEVVLQKTLSSDREQADALLGRPKPLVFQCRLLAMTPWLAGAERPSSSVAPMATVGQQLQRRPAGPSGSLRRPTQRSPRPRTELSENGIGDGGQVAAPAGRAVDVVCASQWIKRRNAPRLDRVRTLSAFGVEQRPNPRGKLILGNWLLDQFDIGVEATLMDDGVARIASHKQNLEARPKDLCLPRKLPPVHAGQHHIRQQQINPRVPLLKEFERGSRIVSTKDSVIEVMKRLDQIGANILVVLDNKDRFVALAGYRFH